MPAQRFIVTWTEDERTQLQALIRKGREHAFRRRRAQIWRQVDVGPWGPGRPDTDTAEILSVGVSTGERARRAFTPQGLTAALQPPALDHPRRERRRDGTGEAALIQLACSPAPAGNSGWTLPRLADRLVELQVVDSMGKETVRVALQKTGGSLGKCAAGACRRSRTELLSAPGKRSWIPTRALWIPHIRWCVWTKSLRFCTRQCALLCPRDPGRPVARMTNTGVWAQPTC